MYEITDSILNVPSITTATFFNGEPPINLLRSRVKAILDKNPWLLGRIAKSNRGGKTGIDLLNETEAVSDGQIDSVFSVVVNKELSSRSSYSDIVAGVEPFSVKIGAQCLNSTTEPLFRVSVVLIDTCSFALIFSLSHVIGDGHTFYTLYAMLNGGDDDDSNMQQAKQKQLVVERDLLFDAKLQVACHGYDFSKWFFSIPTVVNMLTTLAFSRSAEIDIHYVNKQSISAEKQAYARDATDDVPFVSTNDIITSWYFNKTECDVGIMAINFRNRISDITATHAGNYEALIPYQRPDFTSPELIRRSLLGNGTPLRRCISGSLPGPWKTMNSKLALLSTWVSFYQPIHLKGCDEVIHLPCLTSKFAVLADIGILFCPTKDSVAFLNLGRSFKSHKLFGDGMLGDPVFPSPVVLPSVTGKSSNNNSSSSRPQSGWGTWGGLTAVSAIIISGIGAATIAYIWTSR